MIDLILMFFVLVRGIYPLAKEKGKSPVSWMLFTFATWMFVEISIFAISVSPTLFFIALSKQPKDMFFKLVEYQLKLTNIWGVIFIYSMATLGGFLSSLVITRSLRRLEAEEFHEPPAPEVFV